MDKEEANVILRAFLDSYRTKSYEELRYLITKQDKAEVSGESGTKYQLEFQAVWDDKRNGNIRVIGSIDDGGWRALAPMSDSFILSSDGVFIGE